MSPFPLTVWRWPASNPTQSFSGLAGVYLFCHESVVAAAFLRTAELLIQEVPVSDHRRTNNGESLFSGLPKKIVPKHNGCDHNRQPGKSYPQNLIAFVFATSHGQRKYTDW